ncbi:hypothetical protein [Streptomyces harbinensis]|uniref:Uncharacterized protein n=1 Tax=Streptomyces harbinensis TaxID=1176198 RepID=A0A1I6UFN8_9ACTN|nr:hypothetical protein [Streptomyces harbinensis]SFT00309.1 hypothetical protein SAMN05444716_105541 [Streptomyces harbinensis]
MSAMCAFGSEACGELPPRLLVSVAVTPAGTVYACPLCVERYRLVPVAEQPEGTADLMWRAAGGDG